MTFTAHVFALALGLALPVLAPRVPQSLLAADSVLNLLTGGLLYILRLGIGLSGIYAVQVGLIPTLWLAHPLAQWAFAFVLIDVVRYWVHRAHHRVPALWHFHRVHHSAERIDSTVGFRMHLVDFIQLSFLPVLCFGVLLDTSTWAPWVLPTAMIPGIVADALEHSNTRFAPRPAWLRYVFNNPLFHSWHHVRDAERCDGCYANALPVWDVIFGSDVSADAPPDDYGLVPEKDLEPTFFGLHLLRKRR